MSQITTKRFSLYQGTVFSMRRWSDTHIWSSGGGGYVDPKFGGHVAAAQVSSQVVQKVEVFIKDAQGVQHALELTDMGVPLTEGNTVIAVMDERWQGKPQPLYFENVDTRMFDAPIISTGKPRNAAGHGFSRGLLWGGVACLSSYLLGANVFWNAGWLFYCVVGLPAWWMAHRSITSKMQEKFQLSNAAFLSDVQEVAKQNGVTFRLKDPTFGPLIRGI